MIPAISDYAGRAPVADRIVGGRGLFPSCGTTGGEVVSVVTVAFNSDRTIERTIDSIANQTHPNVEHIIVDGASKDRTLHILRKRNDDVALWFSEPDSGISDAFNKGVSLATGSYVAIVNSDDWLEPTHLAVAIETLRVSGADFVYGDLTLHPADDHPPYTLVGDKEYAAKIPHAMPQINHPTLVCRRGLYENHGLFRTDLLAAMDYEWLVRVHRSGAKGVHVPGMTSHMSMEGVSHRNYLQGLREVRDVSVTYGYPRPLAHVRYLIRRLRIQIRMAVHRFAPKPVYDWVRKKMNPHYTTIDR
jgi:glycosyltransferase involved in cell wall biosynthesis